MRTVGPLPADVYWRRRALVAGGVILGVVVLVYSCSGAGQSDANSAATRVALPSATPSRTPSASGSPVNPFLPHASATATPLALGGSVGPTSASPTGPPPPCTDADITLTARADLPDSQPGTYLKLFITVKNASSRACTRDLGSLAQELRVMQGTKRIWSSDDCGGGGTHDVRTLIPGDAQAFYTFWNGRTSAPGCPGGQLVVPAGTYEAVARLGTDLSAPAPFRRTA